MSKKESPNKYINQLMEDESWLWLCHAALTEVIRTQDYDSLEPLLVEASFYHALCLMALIGIHQMRLEGHLGEDT